MFARFTPLVRHGIVLLLLVLGALALFTPAASAEPTALPAVLPAFDMMDVVHDRSRLIQFSLVVVGIGVALLWWGHKS